MKMTIALVVFFSCVFCNAETYHYDAQKIPAQEPQVDRKAKDHGRSVSRQVESELSRGDFLSLAKRTDKTLDYIIERTSVELTKRGYRDLADEATADWNFHYRGFLTRMVLSRDIGDHAPLIEWLARFYAITELALGVEVCKSLHISDIKSLNYGIPVVFKPCSFPMDFVTIERKDEYRNHFNGDKIYYGFLPVIVYWAIDIPCMIGTAGIGALLCGPAASFGEYFSYKFVGPKISDRIFSSACE